MFVFADDGVAGACSFRRTVNDTHAVISTFPTAETTTCAGVIAFDFHRPTVKHIRTRSSGQRTLHWQWRGQLTQARGSDRHRRTIRRLVSVGTRTAAEVRPLRRSATCTAPRRRKCGRRSVFAGLRPGPFASPSQRIRRSWRQHRDLCAMVDEAPGRWRRHRDHRGGHFGCLRIPKPQRRWVNGSPGWLSRTVACRSTEDA